MKSTYSVVVTATISYSVKEYQVQFAFPAAIDFDAFDQFIEDIESLKDLPSVDSLGEILESYYFDDMPDITIHQFS